MDAQLLGYVPLKGTPEASWDYAGEITKTYTHGLHSYPAMMIPPVARRLILTYSDEGATLLDPFCGSGSVLVEAKLAHRYSWGVDLNPLAILIARVKTTPIAPEILNSELEQVLTRIKYTSVENIVFPDFPNLHFWFKENVVIGLAKLLHAINAIEEIRVREFFQVVFSEIARLSSNTRSNEFKLYRYGSDKLERWEPDPILLFRRKALTNINAIAKFSLEANPSFWARPIESDIRKVDKVPANSIDVVVTSPPYGDSRTTVAYGQFSRLSSQWLGLVNGRNIDRETMGGIPLTSLEHSLSSEALSKSISLIAEVDERRAREVLSFYIDLNESLVSIDGLIKKQGMVCFVLGNRTVKGVRLPTDEILVNLFERLAYRHLETFHRNIPNKSMPLQNSPTNKRGVIQDTMHRENIVVMQKL